MAKPKVDIVAARRTVLAAPLALLVATGLKAEVAPANTGRFGLATKLTAKPGRETEVARLLVGLGDVPGCLFFSASADSAQHGVFWTIEFWANSALHEAAVQLPSVQATIASIQPMLANYEPVARLEPGALEAGGRPI